MMDIECKRSKFFLVNRISRWYHQVALVEFNAVYRSISEANSFIEEHLPSLNKEFTANGLNLAFLTHWNTQLNGRCVGGISKRTRRRRGAQNPSLSSALVKAFGRPLLSAGLLLLIHNVLEIVSLQLLNACLLGIEQMQESDLTSNSKVPLTITLLSVHFLCCACQWRFKYMCERVGLKVHGALLLAVQQKALRLKASVLSKLSFSSITFLIQHDCKRVGAGSKYIHFVWSTIPQIAILLKLLANEIGFFPSFGAYLSLSFAFLLFSYAQKTKKSLNRFKWLATKLRKNRSNAPSPFRPFSDDSSLESCITYDEQFQFDLSQTKQRIGKYEKLLAFCDSVCSALIYAGPLLFASISLLLYSIFYIESYGIITSTQILTSLAILKTMWRVTRNSPLALSEIYTAFSASKRIQNFLLQSEVLTVSTPSSVESGVIIDCGTFVHEPYEDLDEFEILKWQSNTRNAMVRESERAAVLLKSLHTEKSTLIGPIMLTRSPRTLQKKSISWTADLLSEGNKNGCVKFFDAGRRHSDSDIKLEKRKNSLEKKVAKSIGIVVEETISAPAETVLALSRISLVVKSGQFVGIIGPRGSGKSALLLAIQGEIRRIGGQQSVYGQIAYIGPKPFIRKTNMYENIVFGLPYSHLRYNSVLTVCELMNAVDSSDISKSAMFETSAFHMKIALARVLYSDARVILLDDSVDCVQEIIPTIVQYALSTNKRCVIMATCYPKKLLNDANFVVFLDGGRIKRSGLLTDIMKNIETKPKFSENEKEILMPVGGLLCEKKHISPPNDLSKYMTNSCFDFSYSSFMPNGSISCQNNSSYKKEQFAFSPNSTVTSQSNVDFVPSAYSNSTQRTIKDSLKSFNCSTQNCFTLNCRRFDHERTQNFVSKIVAVFLPSLATMLCILFPKFPKLYVICGIISIISMSCWGFVLRLQLSNSSLESTFNKDVDLPKDNRRSLLERSTWITDVIETFALVFGLIFFSLWFWFKWLVVGLIVWCKMVNTYRHMHTAVVIKLGQLEIEREEKMHSHLSEFIQGASTIRNSGIFATSALTGQLNQYIDSYTSVQLIMQGCRAWVGMRVDFISTCLFGLCLFYLTLCPDVHSRNDGTTGYQAESEIFIRVLVSVIILCQSVSHAISAMPLCQIQPQY